jgi:hypothetical protein
MALVGCSDPPVEPIDWKPKITFDFTQLDDSGLAGPADGKVAVDYEFLIPDSPSTRAEVENIDPSVKFSYSRGRIGRKEGELLCIGNTHQPNHHEILKDLAELSYVSRIDQCFWE